MAIEYGVSSAFTPLSRRAKPSHFSIGSRTCRAEDSNPSPGKTSHVVAVGLHAVHDRASDESVPKLVEEMMHREFKLMHQMQLHFKDYPYDDRLKQKALCEGVQKAFFDLTGFKFEYQVPTTHTSQSLITPPSPPAFLVHISY